MTQVKSNWDRERRRWYAMRRRCENPADPSYRWYGARGITVCERWREFPNYYADILRLIGPCPHPNMSLDRIDNDGNYEPGNVRWASAWQQVKNSRVYGSSRRRDIGFHLDPIT